MSLIFGASEVEFEDGYVGVEVVMDELLQGIDP